MMKVCIITSAHSPLNHRIFYREAKALLRAGYTVTIIAPHKRNEIVDGIRIVVLPKSRNRLLRMLRSLTALRLALKQKASIYHFHDPELMPISWILKLVSRKPVIFDIHEDYPSMMKIKPWLPKILRPIASKAIALLESKTVKFLDSFITADDATYKKFSQISDRGITLHNFPPKEIFEVGTSKQNQNKLDAIYVGRIDRDRGIFQILQAIKYVHNHGHRARVSFVGRIDPPQLSSKIKDYLNKENMDRFISFVEPIPYPKIPLYIRSAKIGLVPLQTTDKYLKNIPTKLFEYMALGLPIVASDLPPIRQYVEDARCGILVKPADTAAHAEAILYLLNNPAEAMEMGKRGRQAFLTKYNWELEEKKLINFYKELLLKPFQ